MKRSISAEGLAKIAAFQTEPTKVRVNCIIVGEHRASLIVSERISMDDL
jgi:hypothetical protein